MEIVGYTTSDLALAIDAIDATLGEGESVRLRLCTTRLPTDIELANFVVAAHAAGGQTSFPTTRIAGEVAVTEMVLTKGNPLLLLIPIIVPLATIGLITFGIVKLPDISSAIMPILLATGGILLLGVVILAPKAERVATKYVEAGGKLKYLPSTDTIPKAEAGQLDSQAATVDFETRRASATKKLAEWFVERFKETDKFPVLTFEVVEGIVRSYIDRKELIDFADWFLSPEGVQLFKQELRAAAVIHKLIGFNPDNLPSCHLLDTKIKYVIISNRGDTELMEGSNVSLEAFEAANQRAISMGVKPATGYEVPEGYKPDDFGGQYRPGGDIPALEQPATQQDSIVKGTLQKSIDEEIRAKELYLARAAYAKFYDDEKTIELYKHVAGEESHHAEKFAKRLSELDSAALEFIPAGVPPTHGRVDWMSQKKVWRVIGYKGAKDVPMGDYSTKQEAEDKLRELVKEKHLSTEPSVPNPKEELEFIPDSPEYLTETIQSAGWREKIDQAFQMAIQRVRGN